MFFPESVSRCRICCWAVMLSKHFFSLVSCSPLIRSRSPRGSDCTAVVCSALLKIPYMCEGGSVSQWAERKCCRQDSA